MMTVSSRPDKEAQLVDRKPENLVLFGSEVNSSSKDQIAQTLSQSSGKLHYILLGSITEKEYRKCDEIFSQITQMSAKTVAYIPQAGLARPKFESKSFSINYNAATIVYSPAGLNKWQRLKSRFAKVDFPKAGMYTGFALLAMSFAFVSAVVGMGITSEITKESAAFGWNSAKLVWSCLTETRPYTEEEQDIVDALFAFVNRTLERYIHVEDPWNTEALKSRSKHAKVELQKFHMLENTRKILQNCENAQKAFNLREEGLYNYYKFCTLLLRDENCTGRALVAQLLVEFLERIWELPSRHERLVEGTSRDVILFNIARIWIEQAPINSDTFTEAYLHDTTKLLSCIVGKEVTEAALVRLTLWACMQTIEPDMITSIYAWTAYHHVKDRKWQRENSNKREDLKRPAFAHIRLSADEALPITNGWKKTSLAMTCDCQKKDHFVNIEKSWRAFLSPTAKSHPRVPNAFVALILEPCLAHVEIRDSVCCQHDRWAYDPEAESSQRLVDFGEGESRHLDDSLRSHTILALRNEWKVCNICIRAQEKGGAYLAARGCRILAHDSIVEYIDEHTKGCALFALERRIRDGTNFELAYLLPLGLNAPPHSLRNRGRRAQVVSKIQTVRMYPTILDALQAACTQEDQDIENWEIKAETDVPLVLMIQGLFVLQAILPLRINEFQRVQIALGDNISVSACLTIFQLAIAIKRTTGRAQTLSFLLNSITTGMSHHNMVFYYIRNGFRSWIQEILAIPSLRQRARISPPPCDCFLPEYSRIIPKSLRQFAQLRHHGGCEYLEPLAAVFNIVLLPSYGCVAGRSAFVRTDKGPKP